MLGLPGPGSWLSLSSRVSCGCVYETALLAASARAHTQFVTGPVELAPVGGWPGPAARRGARPLRGRGDPPADRRRRAVVRPGWRSRPRARSAATTPHCAPGYPPQAGRTITTWQDQLLAYLTTDRASNGPTGAVNLPNKGIKRVGFRHFDNYRLRLLPHCGTTHRTTPIRGRPPRPVSRSPNLVPGPGAFHRDHVGTEIREHRAREGCGDEVAELPDPAASQGQHHRRHQSRGRRPVLTWVAGISG